MTIASELLKVKGIVIGRHAIYIICGDGVEHLYLFHVIALLGLSGKEELHLVSVKSFGQQPRRIAQPEERLPVLVHQVLSLYCQPSILPRFLRCAQAHGHQHQQHCNQCSHIIIYLWNLKNGTKIRQKG